MLIASDSAGKHLVRSQVRPFGTERLHEESRRRGYSLPAPGFLASVISVQRIPLRPEHEIPLLIRDVIP